MSKGNKSIKKATNQSSLIPNVGAKNIDILHEATLSDASINLQAINPPATATGNGFVAPSNTELAAIDLFAFRENIEIKTGGATLIPFIDYVITTSQVITLTTPATAAQIYHITYINAQKQGVRLVDARPLAVSGTLLDTTTDFIVGDYKVGDNITYQHGAVLVYRGQVLQLRNPANATSGADYQEVAGIIRFNTAASGDEEVSVVSVGSLVETPNGSQMARVEEVQGQIDAMVPFLAIEASVPESTFQGAPNNPDLKAFGDKVNFGLAPIGAILDFWNDGGALALPANYVKCDGQTISDVDSPLNGKTLPNLNVANGVYTIGTDAATHDTTIVGDADHSVSIGTHSHVSAPHTHGAGSLAARVSFEGSDILYFDEVDIANWASSQATDMGTATPGSAGNATVLNGTRVVGTTESTSPAQSGPEGAHTVNIKGASLPVWKVMRIK